MSRRFQTGFDVIIKFVTCWNHFINYIINNLYRARKQCVPLRSARINRIKEVLWRFSDICISVPFYLFFCFLSHCHPIHSDRELWKPHYNATYSCFTRCPIQYVILNKCELNSFRGRQIRWGCLNGKLKTNLWCLCCTFNMNNNNAFSALFIDFNDSIIN